MGESSRGTVSGRQVLLYFAWSRPQETGAPLAVIDDRFPAIFELRRLFYPDFERLADPARVDPGIGGFLDYVQKPNFQGFMDQARAQTGRVGAVAERVAHDGGESRLDAALIGDADTIVVISFDSLRTGQSASPAEVEAARRFLDDPDHLIFVCPHHDIGEATGAAAGERLALQSAEHLHHGDRSTPPRQGFGSFARTLLAGLGVPVENRFGLRPALDSAGAPAPIEVERSRDDLGLLDGVETFNLHPHLPQLERVGGGAERLHVLARQKVDLTAPPHPAFQGCDSFDALLQSNPGVFRGRLLVSDTTLFSSTVGGLDSLRRLWTNAVQRPRRS